MKIALGTAQFGLNYGVSNVSGQVKTPEVRSILKEAIKHNIDTLDTAIAYGSSENFLGKVGVGQFNIVTKLPPVPKNINDIDSWVTNHVKSSLDRMSIKSISRLLLHRSAYLIETPNNKLFESLHRLKDLGVVDKVGVSIYDPEELDALEDCGIRVDIVQAPFNIIDRRLETSGWINKLKQTGVELHTRSVFLQGLILQKEEQRSPYFDTWKDYFDKLSEWIKDTKQTSLSASLNFLYFNIEIDKVIVGVQNKNQLVEILNSISDIHNFLIPRDLMIDDPMLINPTNWKL